MDLNDLKSAWNTYSSQEVDKHLLGKESINELIRKRTKTLVERIDRNLRIGMYVLGVYIAYMIFDYVFLASFLLKFFSHESIQYPKSLESLDIFVTVLITTSYLFFTISYLKIKRSFSVDLQLKNFLTGILNTMITYRRMFYFAITVLLINIALSFAAGLYQGIKFNSPELLENISLPRLLKIIAIGLAFLVPMITGTFLLLRWGFNKLYGRYLVKLNETLLELDESEATE